MVGTRLTTQSIAPSPRQRRGLGAKEKEPFGSLGFSYDLNFCMKVHPISIFDALLHFADEA